MLNRKYISSGFGLQNVRQVEYKAPEGGLSSSEIKYNQNALNENKVQFTVQPDTKSMLGTLVWSDMIIRDPNSNLELYLDTVLFEVNQSKNIVTTSVQGRNGTVKEYISDGDYVISVRGALVNSLGQAYPLDAMKDLIALTDLQTELNIVSPFLQIFNIYSVVITSKSFPQREGFENSQLFTLECLSDEPIELILNA